MLKEWFAASGHESAWGQGLGKGADTAAWMGAVQAELARAKGEAAYGAFIDCEKCYDHVRLADLEFEGSAQGLGRLVRLAARQYRGTRYVRWAGVSPGQRDAPPVPTQGHEADPGGGGPGEATHLR